ncbi:unnamed protein product, partial [Meganyctiphanes norvegica]
MRPQLPHRSPIPHSPAAPSTPTTQGDQGIGEVACNGATASAADGCWEPQQVQGVLLSVGHSPGLVDRVPVVNKNKSSGTQKTILSTGTPEHPSPGGALGASGRKIRRRVSLEDLVTKLHRRSSATLSSNTFSSNTSSLFTSTCSYNSISSSTSSIPSSSTSSSNRLSSSNSTSVLSTSLTSGSSSCITSPNTNFSTGKSFSQPPWSLASSLSPFHASSSPIDTSQTAPQHSTSGSVTTVASGSSHAAVGNATTTTTLSTAPIYHLNTTKTTTLDKTFSTTPHIIPPILNSIYSNVLATAVPTTPMNHQNSITTTTTTISTTSHCLTQPHHASTTISMSNATASSAATVPNTTPCLLLQAQHQQIANTDIGFGNPHLSHTGINTPTSTTMVVSTTASTTYTRVSNTTTTPITSIISTKSSYIISHSSPSITCLPSPSTTSLHSPSTTSLHTPSTNIIPLPSLTNVPTSTTVSLPSHSTSSLSSIIATSTATSFIPFKSLDTKDEECVLEPQCETVVSQTGQICTTVQDATTPPFPTQGDNQSITFNTVSPVFPIREASIPPCLSTEDTIPSVHIIQAAIADVSFTNDIAPAVPALAVTEFLMQAPPTIEATTSSPTTGDNTMAVPITENIPPGFTIPIVSTTEDTIQPATTTPFSTNEVPTPSIPLIEEITPLIPTTQSTTIPLPISKTGTCHNMANATIHQAEACTLASESGGSASEAGVAETSVPSSIMKPSTPEFGVEENNFPMAIVSSPTQKAYIPPLEANVPTQETSLSKSETQEPTSETGILMSEFVIPISEPDIPTSEAVSLEHLTPSPLLFSQKESNLPSTLEASITSLEEKVLQQKDTSLIDLSEGDLVVKSGSTTSLESILPSHIPVVQKLEGSVVPTAHTSKDIDHVPISESVKSLQNTKSPPLNSNDALVPALKMDPYNSKMESIPSFPHQEPPVSLSDNVTCLSTFDTSLSSQGTNYLLSEAVSSLQNLETSLITQQNPQDLISKSVMCLDMSVSPQNSESSSIIKEKNVSYTSESLSTSTSDMSLPLLCKVPKADNSAVVSNPEANVNTLLLSCMLKPEESVLTMPEMLTCNQNINNNYYNSQIFKSIVKKDSHSREHKGANDAIREQLSVCDHYEKISKQLSGCNRSPIDSSNFSNDYKLSHINENFTVKEEFEKYRNSESNLNISLETHCADNKTIAEGDGASNNANLTEDKGVSREQCDNVYVNNRTVEQDMKIVCNDNVRDNLQCKINNMFIPCDNLQDICDLVGETSKKNSDDKDSLVDKLCLRQSPEGYRHTIVDKEDPRSIPGDLVSIENVFKDVTLDNQYNILDKKVQKCLNKDGCKMLGTNTNDLEKCIQIRIDKDCHIMACSEILKNSSQNNMDSAVAEINSKEEKGSQQTALENIKTSTVKQSQIKNPIPNCNKDQSCMFASNLSDSKQTSDAVFDNTSEADLPCVTSVAEAVSHITSLSVVPHDLQLTAISDENEASYTAVAAEPYNTAESVSHLSHKLTTSVWAAQDDITLRSDESHIATELDSSITTA